MALQCYQVPAEKIGLTARDIHANIVATLEDTVALSTVQKCELELGGGRRVLEMSNGLDVLQLLPL